MEDTLQHRPPFQGTFSTQLAIGSFAIGTIIFGSYHVFTDYQLIIIIGFLYLVFTAILNAIVLVDLMYHFIMKPYYRTELAIKILIMLANVPIIAIPVFIKHLTLI